MNALARRLRQTECDGVEMSLAGARIVCDPSGVLYAPDERLLIVSDLHLEKGAAFARRGMMLPPYDTAATLTLLEAALTRYAPQRVISLGDSFHDRTGAALMPEASRETLRRLMTGRDWIWISGHLHPVARVANGARSTRGACFASDGSRMIMPSFGVTTGGLNVLDRAFHGLFDLATAKAYVIGLTRIYPIGFRSLSPG